MAKRVEAFEAADGTHWGSLREAVQHELTVYFDEQLLAAQDAGMVSTRTLALALTDPKHRRALADILNQLG